MMDYKAATSMAMEMAMEMILILDIDGKISACNRAAQEELGYGMELIGMSAAHIFTVENLPDRSDFAFDIMTVRARCEANTTTGMVEITNGVAYRKNSTCFPILFRLMPDRVEPVTYLMGVNMTSHNALEKEYLFFRSETAETLRIKSEFIANVTHELRTPVNGVKGHASALLADRPSPGLKRTLEIILRCCEDMTAIINNILDFSKLEAGKFQLKTTRFDLHEMLRHVIATNIAVANEKGLQIYLHIAENVPQYVYGDDLRLTQILNNLISNAVKFTDIGYISLDVNRHLQHGDEAEIFFIVRDTGIGISPKDQERIFLSFSQVDASSTRKHGGTGLGLVITQKLVEMMGSTIRVESQKGKGSSFSFAVRLTTAEPEIVTGYYSEYREDSIVSRFLEENESFGGCYMTDSFYRFGSEKNTEEIIKKLDVLILALELETWEKAEMIADSLKKLTEGGPEDMRKLLFRLRMAIRKEDETKSKKYYEAFACYFAGGSQKGGNS